MKRFEQDTLPDTQDSSDRALNMLGICSEQAVRTPIRPPAENFNAYGGLPAFELTNSASPSQDVRLELGPETSKIHSVFRDSASHLVTRVEYPDGQAREFDHDEKGRLKTVSEPDGSKQERVSEVDPLGYATWRSADGTETRTRMLVNKEGVLERKDAYGHTHRLKPDGSAEDFKTPEMVDNINSSERHTKMVEAATNLIPENVRNLLGQHGFRTIACGSIVDVRPDLKTVQPQGYPKGSTFENCGGCFDSTVNGSLLPEHWTDFRTKKLETMPYAEGGVLHEAGHALDRLTGASQSSEFKAAYEADIARMTESERERFKYFIQKDSPEGAGRAETFAHIFYLVHGGRHPESLDLPYFPNVAAAIRKKVASI